MREAGVPFDCMARIADRWTGAPDTSHRAASIGEVAGGEAKVRVAGDTIKQLASAVTGVRAVIAQISTANAQQSARIEQVNQAVAQLDQAAQQNAGSSSSRWIATVSFVGR